MSSEGKDKSSGEKKKIRLNIPVISPTIRFVKDYGYIFFIAGMTPFLFHLGMFIFDNQSGVDSIQNDLTTVERQLSAETWVDVNSIIDSGKVWVTNKHAEYAENKYYQKVSHHLERAKEKASRFQTPFIQQAFFYVATAANFALITLNILGLKFALLLTYIPAYIAVCSVGIIDGYVKRKIDTFKGKRDTEGQTEFWFRKFRIATVLIISTYFAIPSQYGLEKIILLSVFATAFTIRMLAANFHKYW